jgi:glutathione synthase/RimK-type ligase-like ATP-grasp enzyme
MPVNLLILSNQDSRSIFRHGSLNRAFRTGLETQEISWRIHHPLAGTPDLSNVDVVMTWCHHIEGNSRVVRLAAIKIEDECGREGVPVVNSARNLRRIRHSFCLHRWLMCDIPCALSQPFATLDQIVLRYPMILRVDGGSHSSLDSFLVRNRAEAEHVISERGCSPRQPLNLAIEYIETVFPDGLYRKRRCIVIGDRVLPRQHMISRTWKVKLSVAESNALSIAEDREFLANGEAQSDLVARGAHALGCDILAIDYSPTPEGGCVFWEANRSFRMAGTGAGTKAFLFREATGRSVEECFAQRGAIGAALGELIVRKAELRGDAAAD